MSSRKLDRPIRLRTSDDEMSEDHEYEDDSGSEQENKNSSDEVSTNDDSSDQSGSEPEADLDNEANPDEEDYKEISFGALAKAHESIAPVPSSSSKKRKASDMEEPHTGIPREPKHPDSRPNQPIHRSSKHAPTILSSKHPVSRKRQVFEPNANLKFRDPRFDATIKQSTLNARASEHADRNYSFLTDYQANEVLDLKSQIKKTKDPDLAADLKRKVMSLEARIRNTLGKAKEREILRKHKESEKQAIREGKKAKPYFLKQSDVRRQIEKERIEGMGKRARDKMEKRKIKRTKGKEGRDLPRFRRSADD